MIVPDVNLLLYAEVNAFPWHGRARKWWEVCLNGDRQVGIAPTALFGFLRIVTNRKVFSAPMAVADAIDRAQQWIARPNVVYLVPGPRHLEIALRLLGKLGTGANLTTDVQIAAHAIEHNAEVYSNDGDFGRFEGLGWHNPLTD